VRGNGSPVRSLRGPGFESRDRVRLNCTLSSFLSLSLSPLTELWTQPKEMRRTQHIAIKGLLLMDMSDP
jgi:hypothetical protein